MSHPSFELNACVLLMSVFHKACLTCLDGEFNKNHLLCDKNNNLKKPNVYFLDSGNFNQIKTTLFTLFVQCRVLKCLTAAYLKINEYAHTDSM